MLQWEQFTQLVARHVMWAAAVMLSVAGLSAAQAAEAEVELAYPWSTLASDTEVLISGSVPPALPHDWPTTWRLVAENNRTLASGSCELQGAKPTRTFQFTLRTPMVRDGVALKTSLELSAAANAAAPRAAKHSQTLWVLPANPFALQQEKLKQWNILLYDPEKTLAPLLEKLEVPFVAIENPDTLAETKAGLLLIGEGVSFRQLPALWEVLMAAAARGIPVLCLAPGDGTLLLPGTAGSALPTPRRVTWRRNDVAPELDARLTWPLAVNDKPAARQFAVRGEGTQVVLDASADADGWPWLEIEYPARRGRLVLCGFKLTEHWKASPTSVWLLAAAMHYVATNKPIFSGEPSQ